MHDFAEAYAIGKTVTPSNSDEEHVKELIDSLSGELRVEEDVSLPLSVDGEQVTVSGVADLIHVLPDRVEIIDYKTDLDRHGESEYRKQLSVYSHVVSEVYPNREIEASIFDPHEGSSQQIDPLSIEDLQKSI